MRSVPLPGLDDHPHARALLTPGLERPSHAYLFHGPPGAGKRTVARAFAAALLAGEAPAPQDIAGRVARDAHPDLTWVTPSGAGEALVADVAPVLAGVAHTPFEARRRVFVVEDAHRLGDQAAARLLKTLEEPPPYAHLVLLAPSPAGVLATIASRCQLVRFDPLPPARLEELLCGEGGGDLGRSERGGDPGEGSSTDSAADPAADRARLAACARLALGDAGLARRLASAEGRAARARAEEYARGALHGETAARPWTALLAAAAEAGTRAGEAHAARVAEELEYVPTRERRRHERDAADTGRRAERRARTGALDLSLRLAQAWLRDAWCVAEGAGEAVYAVDRRAELERDAAGRAPERLARAVELVRDTRLRLAQHVSEELALEALAYRLQTECAATA
jgi:DNA polymerase-3 subunit delta'